MAKKAATPEKKEVVKKAAPSKPPKGFNGTQADWDAVSPAGKIYHQRKSEGLCVRCGKKAAKKKDGTPGLMCQDHLEYIKSFSKKEDKPAGKSTGKQAKGKAKATEAGKKVIAKSKKQKAYKQLGVKQLSEADQHMASIAEE
jgi:hypothetical protein